MSSESRCLKPAWISATLPKGGTAAQVKVEGREGVEAERQGHSGRGWRAPSCDRPARRGDRPPPGAGPGRTERPSRRLPSRYGTKFQKQRGPEQPLGLPLAGRGARVLTVLRGSVAEGEPKVTAVDVLDGNGHLSGRKRGGHAAGPAPAGGGPAHLHVSPRCGGITGHPGPRAASPGAQTPLRARRHCEGAEPAQTAREVSEPHCDGSGFKSRRLRRQPLRGV